MLNRRFVRRIILLMNYYIKYTPTLTNRQNLAYILFEKKGGVAIGRVL